MDWKKEAERLYFQENLTWTQLTNAMRKYFPLLTERQVYDKVRTYLRRTDAYKQRSGQIETKEVKELLAKGGTLKEIAEKSGKSERVVRAEIEDLKESGLNIEENNGVFFISRGFDNNETNIIKNDWNGDKIIRFGLCGDTQINSKYTQITHLHTLYDIYEREGIETVYNTGDIDEGEEMRQGHKYECYTQGADDHIDEIVRVYPRRNNMVTKFITGNHDHSLIKRAGLDIGKSIASEREDMEYLGQSSALIYLTPNCTLELRHPIDGTAYALSYKIQKIVEAMSGGEKPNILAVGHYHKAEYLFYRNVHCIQTGCLQAQTPFMRGKSIAAMMGGWIIEIHVDDEGTIKRFKPEFIPFYKAIKDDYLNWRD